jgi:hypothetical protein
VRTKRWLGDKLVDRGFERRNGAGGVRLIAGLSLTAQDAERLHTRRQAQLDEVLARRALLEAQGINAKAERPSGETPF